MNALFALFLTCGVPMGIFFAGFVAGVAASRAKQRQMFDAPATAARAPQNGALWEPK